LTEDRKGVILNIDDYLCEVLYLEETHMIQLKRFKALSDLNRIQIIDLLSCGELCACDILEKFNFTQPTLAHHMKVLTDCQLVNARKEGKWTYYTLNEVTIQSFKHFITEITTSKSECICKKKEQ
jgi:ArsR family transcriptional regulator